LFDKLKLFNDVANEYLQKTHHSKVSQLLQYVMCFTMFNNEQIYSDTYLALISLPQTRVTEPFSY